MNSIWKSYTDNDPKLQASSNTGDYAVGLAATRIREMGESIAPLLLEVAQTDFFILPIYDQIMAKHPEMIVPSDQRGEQYRAVASAKRFLGIAKENP